VNKQPCSASFDTWKQITCNLQKLDQVLEFAGSSSTREIHWLDEVLLDKQLSMQFEILVKELVSIEASVKIEKQKTFGIQFEDRKYMNYVQTTKK